MNPLVRVMPVLLMTCCWWGQGCVSYEASGDAGAPDADATDGLDAADGVDDGDDGPQGDDGGPGGDDGGSGGDDGGSGGDDGGTDCTVPDPLRVGLQIGEDPWDFPTGGFGELVGPAQVLLVRTGTGGFDAEAWLFFPEDSFVQKVFARLPDGYGLPLRAGQQVWARSSVDMPWWVTYDLEIRRGTADGIRLLHLHEGDAHGGEPDACPAVEDAMGCGTIIHPWLVYETPESPDGLWLRQGSRGLLAAGQRLIKIFIGTFERYEEVWCTDLPGSWLQSAWLNNVQTSQCTCRDNQDCAEGFLCDPTTARCALDRCRADAMVCDPGEICDPYRGECVGAAGLACATDADCAQGQVCNPEVGVCRDDMCAIVDCAPCSSLLGACYQCLHDCDCPAGICDPKERACVPGCQADKLGFGRANQPAYDLFVLCLDARLPDPEAFLANFVESASCGVESPLGACDPDREITCLGALLRESSTSVAVDMAQWMALCGLSRLPAVSRIDGAHLVDR